jgi:hemerythrin-like domain-containing protein
MDALALLKQDHDQVKRMLKQLADEEDVGRRGELFGQLVRDLTVHENIEEELFYPALKQKPEAKQDVLEAFEEHHLVDEVMSDIEDTALDSVDWKAKFTVLTEQLEHHIQDEETKLFAEARRAFDERELADLGARMAALKEEEAQEVEAEQAEELEELQKD